MHSNFSDVLNFNWLFPKPTKTWVNTAFIESEVTFKVVSSKFDLILLRCSTRSSSQWLHWRFCYAVLRFTASWRFPEVRGVNLLGDVNWVLATKSRGLVAPLRWNFCRLCLWLKVSKGGPRMSGITRIVKLWISNSWQCSMTLQWWGTLPGFLTTTVLVLSASVSILAMLNSDSQS